jgi:hypothetical protein
LTNDEQEADMTILEEMLPPPAPRNEALEALIELTCQRVSMLDTAELARRAAHEYDEETVVPPPGSAGEGFLQAVTHAFVRFLAREHRFPGHDEEAEVAAGVPAELPGSQVAQAFVDLGLYYSDHRAAARGADVADFRRVLSAVADELIFALSAEYAPNG